VSDEANMAAWASERIGDMAAERRATTTDGAQLAPPVV
jgi:hypothetical protein